MRIASLGLLLLSLTALGCRAPIAYGQDGKQIFRQAAVSDIACGPSSLFNWMSHGGPELRGIFEQLTDERSAVETVEHLIETYGKRRSATNPSVTRYGRHNGGVGSVNLMLMAEELLDEHLASPPDLRGEYLQRREDESSAGHLERVSRWFQTSIDSGIPVILYLRRYERTAERRSPRLVFGHHVVVTSIGPEVVTTATGTPQIAFSFADSSSGRVERGHLGIAERDFTVGTYTYRFEGERALTDEQLRTGRPLLEARVPSYEVGRSAGSEILVAHFATFAD